MSIIKPFRALRPRPEMAERVACVPYDVVYNEEAAEIIKKNPLSFLRVTRPEGDFADGANPSNEEIFARAKANLQQFIDEKIYAVEAEPALYVYRLNDGTNSQTGIVGCCSLDEYERGLIKKHEKTRPDKVADRTAHILELKAQTGLIFLTFRNTEKIGNLIAATVETAPLYDFSCASCVAQTVWRVELTEELVAAFAEVPALYVADGHHRIESANLARKTMSANDSQPDGAKDYNFVVAGIFPSEDLHIMAYNRAVADLNGLADEEFLSRVAENFNITETTEKEPKKHGSIAMYLSGKWHQLVSNQTTADASDVIENLDVSVLQNYLLQPILNIDDPRTNERIRFVGGARGTAELEKLVDGGAAKVAFSMFPTTMDELLAVADADEIMPPKSTWFEPKLKDGLLIHLI